MLFQALPDQRSGRMERFSFLLFISLGFFVLLLSPPVSDPVAVTPFCLCQCEWVLSFLPLHLCTLFLSLLCWLATVSLSEEVTGCPCGTRACIVLGQTVFVLPGSLVSVLSSPRHLDWIVIPHSFSSKLWSVAYSYSAALGSSLVGVHSCSSSLFPFCPEICCLSCL